MQTDDGNEPPPSDFRIVGTVLGPKVDQVLVRHRSQITLAMVKTQWLKLIIGVAGEDYLFMLYVRLPATCHALGSRPSRWP